MIRHASWLIKEDLSSIALYLSTPCEAQFISNLTQPFFFSCLLFINLILIYSTLCFPYSCK
ncbi:hypothetical protein BDV33DRAFT_168995 [Aspergillus novoparasiticus]|uniref:Uncharacterized protein n=1 Tax=Aspergillus novoparasiticus TaxID=986946 RepID=A0A5N6EZ15_9EURO|nr:hypothetical protein BDV33DRAFT_168995 [Aspergillus novoparasiticus]